MKERLATDRLARAADLGKRAVQLAARSTERGLAKATGEEFSIVDTISPAKAFAKTWTALLQQPGALIDFQHSFALRMMQVWASLGTQNTVSTNDRRFRGEGWETEPVARVLKELHLAIEGATDDLLSNLPDRSKEHLRAKFYTRQLLSALSPANFAIFNPEVRKRAVETDGQSLLDGFEQFLNDLERGDGRLDIDSTDRAAFEVGRNLATTPGKVIFQNDLMQLIQYEPLTETQRKRPILLVPAWINKFYILDMRPENSLVRFLLERGHTVFVISWVNPTKTHEHKGFDAYMKEGPLAALDAIEQATGARETNILGFCIGGILVTATLAWLAARGDDRIKSATTLASMIDFADVGEVGVFIDENRVRVLEAHMAESGYLESYHLQDMFSMIRENDLIWSFHVQNYLLGKPPSAFDLLYWNADATRLPRAMLLWYLEEIYLGNKLRESGALVLDGTPIDVGQINAPMYVLATKEDHIAPWHSVYPSVQIIGSDVTFVLGASGHIAGVINPPKDRVKYGYWTANEQPHDPEQWLATADYTQSSWWEHWSDWLDTQGGTEQIPARVPGKGKLKIIEDAPGSYVAA